MTKQEETKKLVGRESVKFIKSGMKVGLGTGSTMYYVLEKLGELVKEGLEIEGIPTSNATAELAEQFGVPLTNFSKVQELDIAIDGADEVDSNLQLIKGGGGALLREKIVAAAAKEFYVIVDDSKMVTHLGAFHLPVEIIPFAWEVTAKHIAALGCDLELRKVDGDVFISDNGNYILDCDFGQIHSPKKLESDLRKIVGVVETGLFIDMAKKVLVGKDGQVNVIDK